MKTRIDVNTVNSQLMIPHLGVTLRTVFGAAIEAWPGTPGERREFTIIHKGKAVGVLHVQHHPIETN